MIFPMASLVVSIHDVSPRTVASTRAILAELKAMGLDRYSLLIIPDHHRKGHFLADNAFCDWLREQAAAGQEIVIHGYYHQRPQKAGESARDKFMTRFYTANEGEFYDISREQARALVAQAREEFVRQGIDPHGFIAPAWLLSPEAEQALAELGLRFTTRIGGVIDLSKGETHPSQSMVYSVRSAWRRQVSLWWNATLYRRLAANPLLRVGIHPVDYQHPAIWKQIREKIQAALRTREATTYEGFLAGHRNTPRP
jgi:predicted deacetylase